MSFFSRLSKFTSSTVKNTRKTSNYLSSCSFSLTTSPLQVPRVQEAAPHFQGTAVVNQDFKEIKLSDYKGKYLVFYFYPLDFTFVCPTEIIAFSDNYEEFKKTDADILACSTDSHFSHLAWVNTPRKLGGIGEIKYPLLSDFTKVIAKDYGVLIESSGIPLRGLFIIDGKGIIRHMSVNDLPVGRSVEEILRLVKAFQFNDKHGEGTQISEEKKPLLSKPEPKVSFPSKKKFKDFFKQAIVRPKVCPANWQPNTPTIKPNPKDSKNYFEKVNK